MFRREDRDPLRVYQVEAEESEEETRCEPGEFGERVELLGDFGNRRRHNQLI